MTDAYEVIRQDTLTIRLFPDPEPTNPREEFDNFGTMVCWHPRYRLGDKHDFADSEDFRSALVHDALTADEQARIDRIERLLDAQTYTWDAEAQAYRPPLHARERVARLEAEAQRLRELALERYVRLPLYLYDHSGITMRTSAFSDPWDSGQVGWIYVSMEKARENWPGCTDAEVREAAERVLQAEVEGYDQYLTGDVWGYTVEDDDGEELAGCWGVFGLEAAREAAAEEAEPLATAA